MRAIAFSLAVSVVCVVGFAGYELLALARGLPSVTALTDYRPKVPLRVYTADHVLIGEFGEEHRVFVPVADIPALLTKAILAAEDDRFYAHAGVDLISLLRAGKENLSGNRLQGASTITMQVARNFFLSKERTYLRKVQEVMLAYKIEDQLSKDKILELYMNQIYLGERAYGFGSAARIYFDKSIQDLTVAEAAMLAGLPKAPGIANPVANPSRATQRQRYILQRMRTLGFITEEQYTRAAQETLNVRRSQRVAPHSEHAAEMVRQFLYAYYKEETYTRGFNAYTTINSADQEAAYRAVRRGVTDYDRRHGYRGAESFVELPRDDEAREQAIGEALQKHPDSDELRAAVVVAVTSTTVRAQLLSGDEIQIAGKGLRFAAEALDRDAAAEKRLEPGSVIRVAQDRKGAWSITQLPEVAAAFVALDASDGSYRAVVGGFDFAFSQLNHVTQAWRQPGSGIKPFIYSAALERGMFPAAKINDAPLSQDRPNGAPAGWDPKNHGDTYEGPISMRNGLKKSKNLVAIRILRSVTPAYARDHLTRFGFEKSRHPANLTMALGTGAVTPQQMAAGYAVFANGGFRVVPHLIKEVVDGRGKIIYRAHPAHAGNERNRVLSERNVFLMDSMLRDVVNSGTGQAASRVLGRMDLAGKTGTTNDAFDAWFAGYGCNIVAVAWMGYDRPRSLGEREFGGTLSLPIWADYMRNALRCNPPQTKPAPGGLAKVAGDWMYAEYADGRRAAW
ncbi:MAG: penicillin-binding protein [Burkholderia sp.]|nr:penicillin-binding protein [Burkholderia sp.]